MGVFGTCKRNCGLCVLACVSHFSYICDICNEGKSLAKKIPLVSNDNLRVTASLCDFRDMCRLLRVVPAMPAVALLVILCELC